MRGFLFCCRDFCYTKTVTEVPVTKLKNLYFYGTLLLCSCYALVTLPFLHLPPIPVSACFMFFLFVSLFFLVCFCPCLPFNSFHSFPPLSISFFQSLSLSLSLSLPLPLPHPHLSRVLARSLSPSFFLAFPFLSAYFPPYPCPRSLHFFCPSLSLSLSLLYLSIYLSIYIYIYISLSLFLFLSHSFFFFFLLSLSLSPLSSLSLPFIFHSFSPTFHQFFRYQFEEVSCFF